MINTDSIELHQHELFDVFFTIDSDLFSSGYANIFKTFKNTYKIIDVYNNYFVDSCGRKLKPSTLAENTNIVLHEKKCDKVVKIDERPKLKEILLSDLTKFMNRCKEELMLKSDEELKQYLNFSYIPNIDVTNTEIYKEFNKIWSDWKLIDIVNNQPIIDSMCKIIGYIFTPKRRWRYFCVIESTCSGWGKTAFINSICKRSQAFIFKTGTMQEIDKFEFADLYRGQDIAIFDDPGKNIEALASEINNIVANGCGRVREMQRMSVTATDVNTRIVVSTNIPFTGGKGVKLENKMVCIKTNDVLGRNDRQQEQISELATKVINRAPIENINAFISGCVDLLEQDKTWISTHIGLHQNFDEIGAKILDLLDLRFEEFTGKYVIPSNCRTLEDLVKPEYKDDKAYFQSAQLENLKISYTIICGELKKLDFEAQAKYYGTCRFMTGSQAKNRCRNFVLSPKIQEFLCKTATDSDDRLQKNQCFNDAENSSTRDDNRYTYKDFLQKNGSVFDSYDEPF